MYKEKAVVYALRNSVTKRVYVGRTTKSFETRIKQHFQDLKGHRHSVEDLQEDYDRYGRESFDAEVLGRFEDTFEGSRMEAVFMEILRTHDRRFGYNYKDKKGTGYGAKRCRFRQNPFTWSGSQLFMEYLEARETLPPEKRYWLSYTRYKSLKKRRGHSLRRKKQKCS